MRSGLRKKDVAAVWACAGVRGGKLIKDPTAEEMRDKGYAPTFRVKVKKDNGPLVQRIVTIKENGQMDVLVSTPEAELFARSTIVCSAAATGIWVTSAGWGTNWQADEIVVYPSNSDRARKRMRLPGVSSVVVVAAGEKRKRDEDVPQRRQGDDDADESAELTM